MKKVLIIAYGSPLYRDPRVLRQVLALKDSYQIFTMADSPVNDNSIIHYPNRLISESGTELNLIKKRNIFQKIINRLKLYYKLFKEHQNYYESTLSKSFKIKYIFSLDIVPPDVIIANDYPSLYIASMLKKKNNWKAKIYFDAHEYSIYEHKKSFKWYFFMQPIIKYAFKKYKKDINIMTTVCEGLARKYEHFLRFPKGFIKVITNAPEYRENLKPSNIKDNKIRLIHHGGAWKVRKIEIMIEIMNYLDPEKYELTFMLVQDNPEYYEYLIKKAQPYKNIYFIDPVPFNEIAKTINDYDIGIFLLLPEIISYKYALPNKFFEFIQARLAIAIGPSIEMVKIVERYNLGIYSKEFTPISLAEAIKKLTPEKIMEYKNNSDKYAKELSAEENIKKIKEIISELDT